MLNKLVLAAVATAIALPAAAAGINPGNAMIADLVNVDAASFSTSELGQISTERNATERAARAEYILQQRANGYQSAVASDSTPTDYFGARRTGRDD